MFSVSPPDLPNEMAWGHRKKMFYDSDYVAASELFYFSAVEPPLLARI
uniref:Uncharacterized protein n=1 Tax=Anguilla anguilla TaxID=7936 RepID=A0A0E9UJE5_ANGAN